MSTSLPSPSWMALNYHTVPSKFIHLIFDFFLISLQVAPLKWSKSSVKDDFSLLPYITISFLQNWHVLFSELEIGAGTVFWRQSSRLLLFCLMSMVTKPLFLMTGIAYPNHSCGWSCWTYLGLIVCCVVLCCCLILPLLCHSIVVVLSVSRMCIVCYVT